MRSNLTVGSIIPIIIVGEYNMLETVVIKPYIKQQFDKFMQDGRILFLVRHVDLERQR